ncbi:hypothetical protein KGM_213758 [Danaus plexippus plexippus]|uniref:Uncharacterized protein n=1 Tax=Danaus plexippus plexippus TaxID=278856 RepID=A0A212EZT2_DANPL|nr:hypothetical protein KGM_213758 [Danaus plexippus plexippus]
MQFAINGVFAIQYGEETTNTTSETVSEKKEGVEPPAERRRPPRKADADNKWAHDKYNENEQVTEYTDIQTWTQ